MQLILELFKLFVPIQSTPVLFFVSASLNNRGMESIYLISVKILTTDRRHGYDMPSDLLLLQEQIDITLWLLVKHYRWVTKGFGEKVKLGKTENQQVMTT